MVSKFLQDAELIQLRSSLDFDLDLINSNIDIYYGVFGGGVWITSLYSLKI
jgi:hypothetical protein